MNQNYMNYIKMCFPSIKENKEFVSTTVLTFAKQLNPSKYEIEDIRTAVNEAVDNCICFAYPNGIGQICITCKILKGNILNIIVKDNGVGIENVKESKQALVSSNLEHSGLGFTVIESFMDKLTVSSVVGKGTTLNMKKKIGK